MDRKYSVQELDALRHRVQNKYLYGSYTGPSFAGNGGMSRQYREDEMAKVVEEEVRTCMLAGLTAEDLTRSDPLRSRAKVRCQDSSTWRN